MSGLRPRRGAVSEQGLGRRGRSGEEDGGRVRDEVATRGVGKKNSKVLNRHI